MHDILIVGIGNPFRGDDGAGWAVIDALQEKNLCNIKLCKQMGDVAELIDLFSLSPTVYLIDACQADAPPGSWQRLDLKQQHLGVENTLTSTHGFSIKATVALAENLHQLPQRLILYVICGNHFTMTDALSPQVQKATLNVTYALLNEEDIQACMKKV